MSPIVEPGRTTTTKAATQLEQLKHFTKVVADTGDFASFRRYEPQDATTNPSLILKAAEMPEYGYLVDEAIRDEPKGAAPSEKSLSRIMERLLVLFGKEILKQVPGRVSTETDPALSFDSAGLVEQARRFIALYGQKNVPRERVLIKIASTWEGIRAAEALQKESINCNMTLLFSLPQAVACAEAGARLISPFVGRILDWYRSKTAKHYAPDEDPGVLSVREIYAYYKHFGYGTEVMGASFRSKEEVLALAGCDLLTISPKLLEELLSSTERVERHLAPDMARDPKLQRLSFDESRFRWLLNENAMATEKLAEGIRNFQSDLLKLREYIAGRTAPGHPSSVAPGSSQSG